MLELPVFLETMLREGSAMLRISRAFRAWRGSPQEPCNYSEWP